MTTSGDASVYYALPQPEASAPPTVRWVTPSLERRTRIPHSGGAVHRVCWFLLLVYVVWGGDCWRSVWVQPPSLAALPFLLCACTISTFIHSLSSASRSQTTSNPGGVLSCTVSRSHTTAYWCQRAHYEAPQLEPGCTVCVLAGLIEGSLLAVCPVAGGGGLGDESKLDCSRVCVAYSGAEQL